MFVRVSPNRLCKVNPVERNDDGNIQDIVKVRVKAKIMNQYNKIPHLTQDTIWESDKNTRKNHTQEKQEVSPFPAGDHEDSRNKQDSMKDMKQK